MTALGPKFSQRDEFPEGWKRHLKDELNAGWASVGDGAPNLKVRGAMLRVIPLIKEYAEPLDPYDPWVVQFYSDEHYTAFMVRWS